jgi:hypothetical protein
MEVFIALAGIALGNGWIDARVKRPLPLIMRIGMECWTIHSRQFACGMGALHQQFNNEDIASGDNKTATTTTGTSAAPHNFNVPDGVFHDDRLWHAGEGSLVEAWGPNTYDVTSGDPYQFFRILVRLVLCVSRNKAINTIFPFTTLSKFMISLKYQQPTTIPRVKGGYQQPTT